MNKNAAIIEGDTTKKFNPVSKVKVSNSDTGESTWIPEDSKETHSLNVIKNGIYYAASEGYTAYDTVTVNVSSETEVNYEGILADMPDLADLGLYDLDDLEGLDGLDLDLDELEDLENLLLDGDLEEGEIPESGATIKGIDPDTGETLEVGLDEDGNLMEQALPDHIHIVVWPRKRHYKVDEIIDLSGIHVYLMKKGTERFTCEQYPTGEIPFEELMHEPISAESGTPIISNVSHVGDHVATWKTTGWTFTREMRKAYDGEAYCTFARVKDNYYHKYYYEPVIIAYEQNGAVPEVREVELPSSSWHTTGPVSQRGGYWTYAGYGTNGDLESSDRPVFGEFENTGEMVDAIIEAIAGGIPGENVVTVSWMRSDGEILEDTFPITIGEGEDPEPEPDPYAGAYDFIWEGKAYCFNKSLARSEVMYSNGTVWQTWLGGQSPPYTVDQALKLKLIVQVGWSGGGSTSGDF